VTLALERAHAHSGTPQHHVALKRDDPANKVNKRLMREPVHESFVDIERIPQLAPKHPRSTQ
jgi:hypothetical protein